MSASLSESSRTEIRLRNGRAEDGELCLRLFPFFCYHAVCMLDSAFVLSISQSLFLSGRADLARCYPLTESLNVRDALKEICLDAGTVISSPVFGFRPVCSARSRTRNVPSPVRCTSSPAASASVRTSTNELYIFSASFVLESAFSAILRTNSAFVILFSTGRMPVPSFPWYFLPVLWSVPCLFLCFFFALRKILLNGGYSESLLPDVYGEQHEEKGVNAHP